MCDRQFGFWAELKYGSNLGIVPRQFHGARQPKATPMDGDHARQALIRACPRWGLCDAQIGVEPAFLAALRNADFACHTRVGLDLGLGWVRAEH